MRMKIKIFLFAAQLTECMNVMLRECKCHGCRGGAEAPAVSGLGGTAWYGAKAPRPMLGPRELVARLGTLGSLPRLRVPRRGASKDGRSRRPKLRMQ